MQPFLFSLVVGVESHGSLSLPPSRNGGSLSKGSDKDSHAWYTSFSPTPGEPSLPSELNTHHICEGNHIPWCAPGTAPVLSPCGKGCVDPSKDPFGTGDYACPNPTLLDGLDLPKTKRMVWHQDAIVDVAWSISIGHGGGYVYRLCPAGQESEDCFQKIEHHMEFVDDYHTIVWTDDDKEEVIPAQRTRTGTYPAGSQWSKNPIPAVGRGRNTLEDPCSLHECGTYPGVNDDQASFSIKDRVRVPAVAPGNYTVSWRWDCEETSNQVWTNCADVEILPSACPGGSLPDCIAMCPQSVPAAYEACTKTCLQRCNSIVL